MTDAAESLRRIAAALEVIRDRLLGPARPDASPVTLAPDPGVVIEARTGLTHYSNCVRKIRVKLRWWAAAIPDPGAKGVLARYAEKIAEVVLVSRRAGLLESWTTGDMQYNQRAADAFDPAAFDWARVKVTPARRARLNTLLTMVRGSHGPTTQETRP